MTLPYYQFRNSSHSTGPLTKGFARFCLVAGSILLLVIAIVAFDANKGYQIQQTDTNQYVITVTVSRDTATTALNKMQKFGFPFWGVRSMCLPNGFYYTATATREEISQFLESEQDSFTIQNTWDYQTAVATITDEENNYIRYNIEISYRELVDALAAARENNDEYVTFDRYMAPPNSRRIQCAITLDEAENYQRQMHRTGARKIIFPFFFSLDGANHPRNYYYIL